MTTTSPPEFPPTAPPRGRWRPSTLIRGSVAAHAAALGVLVARPQAWPWIVSGVAADGVLLAVAGLLPRCGWLGPNVTRLPPAAGPATVAITIDDGPDPEVTPRVLDLLDTLGVRATFFCIGERVAAHPHLARTIVERGHSIANHTHRHPLNFSLYGPRAIAAEIADAQAAITAATGCVPRHFRAPAGLRNVLLEPALARAGLALVAWTRRGFDTVTGEPPRVLGRLTRNLRAGDILLLHDGHAARTPANIPVLLEVLPPLVAALRASQLTPVTLDAALPPRGASAAA